MFEARRAPSQKAAIHSPVVDVSTNWDVFAEMRWLGKQWPACLAVKGEPCGAGPGPNPAGVCDPAGLGSSGARAQSLQLVS